MAALLLSVSLNAASDGRTELFREAVSLYNAGMYERAASLFDRLKGDSVSDGYALLCAIKMRASGLDALVADYEEEWENTPLSNQIDWEYGRVLFDAARYSDAAGRLQRVEPGKLENIQLVDISLCSGGAERQPEAPVSVLLRLPALADAGKLLEYGKKVGNLSVLKRMAYLSELWEMEGFDDFRSEVSRMLNSKYSLLDPFGDNRGPFIDKWKIRSNIGKDDLDGIREKIY